MDKKKIKILVVILLILFIGLGTVIAIVANNDTEAEKTTTTSTVEQSTPVDAEVTTTVPSSESEVTEESTSTNESNEATEEPMTTEEPDDTTTESAEPTQSSVHTHSYSSKVTQPTCTSQGYTTYTCNCGHSYKDNYTNGSHNYLNGTCTACGAADPNWVPPHTHSWTEHTWTEDVVSGQMVDYIVCNSCGAEFTDFASLDAHQASTGGGDDYRHSGWHNNNKWVETNTQITHHYRECACGAREDID